MQQLGLTFSICPEYIRRIHIPPPILVDMFNIWTRRKQPGEREGFIALGLEK